MDPVLQVIGNALLSHDAFYLAPEIFKQPAGADKYIRPSRVCCAAMPMVEGNRRADHPAAAMVNRMGIVEADIGFARGRTEHQGIDGK